MCAMEMVAWLAGEAHTDEPRCACPVLAALVRATNDGMSDRQRESALRPLVPLLVNSRSTPAVEAARGWLAVDRLVRELAPRLLQRQRDVQDARVLAGLPPVRGVVGAQTARLALTTCARPPREAVWVLDRAIDGQPPHRYVAALAQAARALGGGEAYQALVELARDMLAVGRSAPRGARVSAAGR